jgi:hypothetical protein
MKMIEKRHNNPGLGMNILAGGTVAVMAGLWALSPSPEMTIRNVEDMLIGDYSAKVSVIISDGDLTLRKEYRRDNGGNVNGYAEIVDYGSSIIIKKNVYKEGVKPLSFIRANNHLEPRLMTAQEEKRMNEEYRDLIKR